MTDPLRIAWFSPLPPAGSGVAAYSAELLPHLASSFAIDAYDARNAGEFAWRHRRAPYDLTVFQLGNAAWHDHMWGYLASAPGLVILHDARVHQARARQLLAAGRADDYRREFAYDHPEAPPGFAEYAVAGLGGPVYYLWRMIAVAVRTARGVAVHNARVAADLAGEFPDVRFDTIRMGVPAIDVDAAAAATTRRDMHVAADAVVFAAFGKVTSEKRIAPVLRAAAALARAGRPVHLLLIGDASGYPALSAEVAAAGLVDRVTLAGEVPDADLARYLGAADACLCLRWPTAEETSASWLRCLAAGRPTIVTDLPHLADVPVLLARGWRPSHPSSAPVAVAVDLVEQDESLHAAMARLAEDADLRAAIAAAGHAHWRAHHRLELMVEDYRMLMRNVAARPAPRAPGLPSHFTDDYSARARSIAAEFGVDVDILGPR